MAEGLGVVAVGSLRSCHVPNPKHFQISQGPASASSPEAWLSFHSLVTLVPALGSYFGKALCKRSFCHKFGRLHVAASLRTFGGMVALVLGLKCVEGSVREIDRIHVRGGGVYGAYRTTALRQSPLCKASIACF